MSTPFKVSLTLQVDLFKMYSSYIEIFNDVINYVDPTKCNPDVAKLIEVALRRAKLTHRRVFETRDPINYHSKVISSCLFRGSPGMRSCSRQANSESV